MFMDSEGRYITAGQWHDEKFKAFTDPWQYQAQAPSSMILGGMKEAGADDPIEQIDVIKKPVIAAEEIKEVSVEA